MCVCVLKKHTRIHLRMPTRFVLSCRVLCYAALCCAWYAVLRCAALRLPVGAALCYAPSYTLGCVT